MLFGTTAQEVNFSFPRGVVTICAACGKGTGIRTEAIMWDPRAEGDHTTAPAQLCVKFTCNHCEQVVQVWPDGTSKIIKPSKNYREWLDNVNDAMEAKMKEAIGGDSN